MLRFPSSVWIAGFAVLLVTCLCSPGYAQSVTVEQLNKDCEKSVAPLWEKVAVKADQGWQCRVSPVLPESWPPKKGTGLCCYAYGYSPGGLLDAEQETAPIACVTIAPDTGKVTNVKSLSNQIKTLGKQGFWPSTPKETAIWNTGDAVQQTLLKAAGGAALAEQEQAQLREYYRNWYRTNLVIASHIEPLHKDFFHWLKQDWTPKFGPLF